jgi:hypothetical protein
MIAEKLQIYQFVTLMEKYGASPCCCSKVNTDASGKVVEICEITLRPVYVCKLLN